MIETSTVVPVATERTRVRVPMRFADGFSTTADVVTFDGLIDGREHLLLGLGDWRAAMERAADGGDAPLVRPHSECLTGDVFGSERCDCGEQLDAAMTMIEQAGTGVLVYMFDEGRGIGLLNKIRAYALQDEGHDTVEANHALGFAADMRDYSAGAHILFDLGVRQVRLMTNNPDKVQALENYGLSVVERVPVEAPPRTANKAYLQTKRKKFGHLLSMVGEAQDSEKPKN